LLSSEFFLFHESRSPGGLKITFSVSLKRDEAASPSSHSPRKFQAALMKLM
jgi:hypothetical protein